MSTIRGNSGQFRAWSAVAAISAMALSGCFGLGKRSDARDAVENTVVRQFALSLEQQSSLSRSSGEVTFMRLNALFPGAGMTETPFTLLGGTGLDRAFGQMQRPSSALAQVALRNRVTALCRSQIESSDKSAVFSTQNILVSGESLPADPATLAAFAAARNIWLDLYKPDSPEVQALANLYAATVAASNSGNSSGTPDLEAKRAVCEAALLAPQFWLGNATPTDVIRRVSLDIGRRIPKLSDMAKFASGSMSLADYLGDIQKNEPGYWQWLHMLNEEWLGLRPFTNGPADLRPTVYSAGVAGVGGSSLTAGHAFGASTDAAFGQVLTPAAEYGVSPEACQDKEQAFDPDTNYVIWEHKDMSIPNDQGKWLMIGAWVRADSVTAFKSNYLAAEASGTYPDYTTDQLFNLLCLAPGAQGNSSPDWYMCNGLIPMSAAFKTAMNNELSWLDNEITYYQNALTQEQQTTKRQNYIDYYSWLVNTWFPGFKPPITSRVLTAASNNQYFQVYMSDIVGSSTSGSNGTYGSGFLGYFDSYYRVAQNPATGSWPFDHRRLRRFSPSGEQNGYSVVNLWHTKQPIHVCNTISRFPVACFNRPPQGAFPTVAPASWNANMGKEGLDGYHFLIESMSHPDVLQNFRCGPPNYGAILSWSTEDAMYPKGSVGNVNNLAGNISESFDSSQPEGQALAQINTDLHQEPYYLIDYIVKNDMDFMDILTADYSCGHSDMERYYKSQGYYLPVDVTAYDTVGGGADCSVDANDHREIFTLKSTRMPTNLIRTSGGGYEAGVQGSFDGSSGTMNPRPMSGILTMAAYLSPVAPKMRTISSRYFTRLLCGEPSEFAPQTPYDAGGQELHAQFISQSSVHQGHLRADCRQCHINLDPLASALSASFVQHEGDGTDEIGEIIPLPFGEVPIYGVRGGGPKGQGALLGQAVSGVREVGQHLAASREFAHCVVTKAFQNVFGRDIGVTDAQFVNDATTRFMSHHRWNKLIQDLVESPNYQRRN